MHVTVKQLTLVLVMGAASILAQTTPTNPLVPAALRDYAQTLMEENPAVRAAQAQWRAELRKVALAKGLPDPSVSFGYFVQNVETAVGPQEYKLGIRQPIPWPGKLVVQGQIQSEKAKAAYEAFQAEAQGKVLALFRLYYDAYFLERSIDITRHHLDLVRQWESVSAVKYRSAQVRHLQLVKAQIESARLADDLSTLQARRDPLLAAFRALLHRPALKHIAVPDSLTYSGDPLNKTEIFNRVIENNPALARMHAVEAAALKSVDRARLNALPDLGVGVERVFTGDRFTSTGEPVPQSGKDPWVVSASVSIPLWIGQQRARVEGARQEASAARWRGLDREDALRIEVENAWFDLQDAKRKASLYGDDLLPKALESLGASEAAYAGGEADFMSLIDAQRLLLQLTLERERATVKAYQAMAALSALTGDLPASVSSRKDEHP